MRSRRGFTLLELAIVVAILSVIIAVGVPYLRRGSANSTLAATANQAKALLGEASAKAKSTASEPTMPATTSDKDDRANVEFNEIRTLQGAQKVGSQTFATTHAQIRIQGPNVTDTNKAVSVALCMNGSAVATIQVFDGSGAGLWESQIYLSNDFTTQRLVSKRGSSNVTLTRSESPNERP